MSISAPFVRRPIATSLLMAGILLVGVVAWPLLPVAAAAAGGFSDHLGDRPVCRGQPRDDGLLGGHAARISVRADSRV
jgi:hypothetical protein